MSNTTMILISLKSKEVMEPYESNYSIYLSFMFILNTAIWLISIYYTVNSKFKASPEFRPISIYSSFVGWLLISFLSITQPVSFNGLSGGYANGIVKYLGSDFCFLNFYVFLACTLQLSMVYTLAFLLQFSRMEVISQNFFVNTIRWFDTSRKVWNFLNFMFLFHMFISIFPFYYLRSSTIDLTGLQESRDFLQINPSFHIIQVERNFAYKFVFYAITFILIFEMLFSLFANLLTFRSIKSTSYFVNKNTLKTQMFMYRVFTLQMIVMMIFFYSPIIIAVFNKTGLVDPILIIPIFVCTVILYYPAQFLVSICQFPTQWKSIFQSRVNPMNTSQPRKNISTIILRGTVN